MRGRAEASLWCPSDRGISSNPTAVVSYYWKAAVDAAWYGGPDGTGPVCRREGDFSFPAEQIVLYERTGWHWGGRNKGLTDGVVINCAFMDGRVAAVEIRESGYTRREDPAEPLPGSGMGEPAWFNYSFGADNPQFSAGPNWDPHVWGDNLREVDWPVGEPPKDTAPSCQQNLKALVLALQMYAGDYDSALPSSYLYSRTATWDPDSFVRFAGVRGTLPPRNQSQLTWPMVLYDYVRDTSIIWCPRDRSESGDPAAVVSYYWKAAVDAAWYGGPDGTGPVCRKEGDFCFPAEQIVLYERIGWHWGRSKGLTDGVVVNCAFMDGHVAAKTIRDSGYTVHEMPALPLPASGIGEPAWFNYSYGAAVPDYSKGAHWDPHVWGDSLP
jgi:prepilin-type processing-associated H-X9-DG protein